jgi:hypothetical protein
MYHVIVYHSKTGEIIRSYKISNVDTLPNPRSPEEAQVVVADKEHLGIMANLDFRKDRLSGRVQDRRIVALKVTPVFHGKISLTTDAPDWDGDGKPELPADGKSATIIRASLRDVAGKVMEDQPVSVRFRVTRGSLSAREAATKNGLAEVKLTSAPETTECRVLAMAPGFETQSLILEFIPPQDYNSLARQASAC